MVQTRRNIKKGKTMRSIRVSPWHGMLCALIVSSAVVACSQTTGKAQGSPASGLPPASPPSSGLTFCQAPGNRTLKVYLAGESIEERNRFVEQPLNCNGSLNQRGGGEASNDNEEYGWMVPLAQRLNLRDPSLSLEFVGSSDWSDTNDGPYSGTVPAVAGRTSAISGLDIPTWLDVGSPDRGLPGRRAELASKTHCYQVAFATRGGNDLNAEVTSEDYKRNLKLLVKLLLAGSSCLTDPIVYVTTHLPDRFEIEGMERVFLNLALQFPERTGQQSRASGGCVHRL
jgi:hypothetical protein